MFLSVKTKNLPSSSECAALHPQKSLGMIACQVNSWNNPHVNVFLVGTYDAYPADKPRPKQKVKRQTERSNIRLPPIFRHQLLVRTYTDLLPDLSNFWKLQSAFGIWQSTLNLYIIVDVFHWRMIVNRVRNHWTTWRDHHSQEFCPSGNILFIKVRNQWKQQTRKQKNGLLNE